MTLFIVVIGVLISMTACQKKEYTNEEFYEEFKKNVSKIESYSCIAEMDVMSNKGKSSYTLKQSYDKSNEYKIEFISPNHLKGKVIVYKDDKVIIKNTDINDTIELSNQNKGELIIGAFMRSYIEADDINIDSSDEYITLEIKIPNEEDLSKQILYINKESKLPDKLELLDKDENIRISIKYKDIEYKK